MDFKFDKNFALELDKKDPLRNFRNEFLFPQHNGREVVYFTGNSLGLQPKGATQALQQELNDWEKYGVEGHFKAKNPWFSYHEMFAEPLAKLVGALPSEVVAMNGLTTNLHLMMISFYQPTSTRYKIICEAKAFPSDQYALESQVKLHGLHLEDSLIEIAPRPGEHLIRTEDVLSAIEQAGESLALVMIGGVNYYTGQVFEMEKITAAGHAVGANVGWDLAHGAGNIPLKLHDWGVDFACWCSYKYLNSGPGSVSGAFIHQKHCNNTNLIRLAGWWGHDKETRFLMQKGFKPMKTAEAWQLSNAPVLAMAVHKIALDLHNKAGIDKLRKKSIHLTNYLEYVIQQVSNQHPNSSFEIITPKNAEERGCQLSILAHGHGKSLFETITQEGVVADWREPNVIRIAPVPIYNSFEDCYRFGEILSSAIEQGK